MIRKWAWRAAWVLVLGLGAVWLQGQPDRAAPAVQLVERGAERSVVHEGAQAATRAVAPVEAPVADAAVPLAALPPQGRDVMAQIARGGPFRYEKDGTVFGNRERILPAGTRGFYREYTVPTPGLSHRGARRIVCGGQKPREPEACYYTEDHYNSFRRIVH